MDVEELNYDEILNMGMSLSSNLTSGTNTSDSSSYSNFTECRNLYENLDLHSGYVGPVYEPTDIEDFLHNLDRSTSTNFSRLEYESEEQSYWDGVMSTFPIVLAIIGAILTGILTLELILRWTNRRYREWRLNFVKSFSALDDPDNVDEDKILEEKGPRLAVFVQMAKIFCQDSLLGNSPVVVRRLFCWVYILGGLTLVITAWVYLRKGFEALSDGIDDSTSGLDETEIYLEDVLRVLYQVDSELEASYQFYYHFVDSCLQNVSNVFTEAYKAEIEDDLAEAEAAYAFGHETVADLIDVVILMKDAVSESSDSASNSKTYLHIIMFAMLLSVIMLLFMMVPTFVVLLHATPYVWPTYAKYRNKFYALCDEQLAKLPCMKEGAKGDSMKGEKVEELKGIPEASEVYMGLGLGIVALWTISILTLRISVFGSDYCHQANWNTAQFVTKWAVDTQFDSMGWDEATQESMEVVLREAMHYYTSCPANPENNTYAQTLEAMYGLLNISDSDVTRVISQSLDDFYNSVCGATAESEEMLELIESLDNTEWSQEWLYEPVDCGPASLPPPPPPMTPSPTTARTSDSPTSVSSAPTSVSPTIVSAAPTADSISLSPTATTAPTVPPTTQPPSSLASPPPPSPSPPPPSPSPPPPSPSPPPPSPPPFIFPGGLGRRRLMQLPEDDPFPNSNNPPPDPLVKAPPSNPAEAAVMEQWTQIYCDSTGLPNSSELAAFNDSVTMYLAATATENISVSFSEVEEAYTTCCSQSAYEIKEAALGFIPVVCEALDLLECYDINSRYVLVVHDGVCEGAVSNGMGYVGFGVFFLSLAFCHLALWTAKSIYIFGMYKLSFLHTFSFQKPEKRKSVYIIEKRKSILDERDRLAALNAPANKENANYKDQAVANDCRQEELTTQVNPIFHEGAESVIMEYGNCEVSEGAVVENGNFGVNSGKLEHRLNYQ